MSMKTFDLSYISATYFLPVSACSILIMAAWKVLSTILIACSKCFPANNKFSAYAILRIFQLHKLKNVKLEIRLTRCPADNLLNAGTVQNSSQIFVHHLYVC